MNTIEIGLNTSILPCVVTTKGDFCRSNHSLYISCNENSTLYDMYSWYLGTIWIGNNHLDTIPKKQMSDVLKHIDSKIDKSIHSQLPNLGKQLYRRIQEICLELQHHFPNIEFKIQNHSICVPEISKQFIQNYKLEGIDSVLSNE